MEQVFLKIDTDNSGNLSLEEVVLFLKSITDDISEDNIEKIFEGIDTSGDKVVAQGHSMRIFVRKMVQECGVWQKKPLTSPD